MLRSAGRRTKDVVCAGLATMTNTAAGRPHLCAQPAIAAVRSQSRALRCSVVAGPGRFSARCFSTEPVLQNAANPEMPAAPIQKPAPDNPDGSVVVSEKVERLCNDILSLNMLELNQLLKVLKARLGLTDADLRGAVVASPGAGAPAEAAAEEKAPAKDTFDLKLVGFDEKSKIKVIKEVRGISGLGLKEAKELVEGVPKVIKKGLKKDEAEKLAEKLKEAGAKVELD